MRKKPSLATFAAVLALSATPLAPAWAQATQPGSRQATPGRSQDAPLEAPLPPAPEVVPPPGHAAPNAAQPPAAARKSVETNPKDPQDREAMLAELYVHLAKAPDAAEATPISKTIERLWAYTDSATISLLMNRANKAVADERYDLAQKLLDAVVELRPDYAEGWARRAYVYYLQNDLEHAVGDLRRTLALEPNHYKALDGLARILRDSGQKKSALGAYRQLLKINPYMPGAKDAADELTIEVEGRGI